MNEHFRITYASSIEQLCEFNHSFDHGVLKVAYTGVNNNGSCISREVFESCIHTIYNCPIVCNYNREKDEIGGHDSEIVEKDGVLTLVNITQPVGVVPESAKYWFEEYEDMTGVHEYLCVDVLIWKRQEAYAKIKENVITSESMEINITSSHREDGVYVIDSFEFLALCLLERDKPCFELASLELFNATNFREQYTEMIEDFKRDFKLSNAFVESIESPKGGEEQLDQKMELLAKFGLSIEDIKFDIDSMSVEELESKLQKEQFSLTGEQLTSGLIDALSQEKVDTQWGTMNKYCYCDFDYSANEVYFYDTEDWNLYGAKYSLNGDNVIVDFESKKRKKFSIVDFDEGEAKFSHEHIFNEIANASASKTAEQFESQKAELEQKFNTASTEINNLNVELNELRIYKQQKLNDEREAAENAVFSMFEDLNGIDAFSDLRANCSEMTVEEIEEKCYALRGRNQTLKFSAGTPQKGVRLPIDKGQTAEDEPYGGLFKEFPPNR